jgi:hypothetical protein
MLNRSKDPDKVPEDRLMIRGVLIAPSTRSAGFTTLGAKLRAIDAARCDWIRVDVME